MQLIESIGLWELWGSLGWKDVKRRYRRTMLGPFWMTLSMALLITTLTVLCAELFKVNIRVMLPYISAGMIGWTLISTLANEGCTAFTQVEATIRQQRFPYLICVYRVAWRNTIVFGHHLLIQVVVVAISGTPVRWATLLLVPGLLLVLVNATWFIVLIGLLCTRYRDIAQVVANVMTIMMFVTPVFWLPDLTVHIRPYFVELNIFYHLLEVLRQPMLGKAAAPASYALTTATAVLGWALAAAVYRRYHRMIPFWL